MNIEEGIRQSFEVITGNKLRSFLTMLGIIFGVGCLIAISIVGYAFRTSISGELGKYGSTLTWIQTNWRAYTNQERVIPLDDRDVQFFTNNLPGVEYSGSIFTMQRTVSYQGQSRTLSVYGVGPDHFVIFANEMASGRNFGEHDVIARNHVCVLRPDIASVLFEGEEPIGKRIRIGSDIFTVIGVTEPLENAMLTDGSGNGTVFVPSDFVSRAVFGGGTKSYWVYFLRFRDAESVAIGTERIEAYLANRHGYLRGEPRFQIQKMDSFIGTVNTVLDTVTTLVGVIAAVSLLVGGLGIMNIMLVTVTERTREIGVRMAIGARRRDILTQFLIEAVTLCLLGGALGTAFGAGLAAIACSLLDWEFVVSPNTVALAVGVSSGIGLLFGTYPAHKASRLTPIDALRSEV